MAVRKKTVARKKTKGKAKKDTLGHLIDEWKQLRDRRMQSQKSVDALARQERELEYQVLARLQEQDLPGASGVLATATRDLVRVPQVKDWEAFYEYVLENEALDLLERRISRLAWRDREELEGPIPGVGSEQLARVRLTSKRGK